MNAMKYEGYATCIKYSDEDDLFVGHIVGIRDLVGFRGESVQAPSTTTLTPVPN